MSIFHNMLDTGNWSVSVKMHCNKLCDVHILIMLVIIDSYGFVICRCFQACIYIYIFPGGSSMPELPPHGAVRVWVSVRMPAGDGSVHRKTPGRRGFVSHQLNWRMKSGAVLLYLYIQNTICCKFWNWIC